MYYLLCAFRMDLESRIMKQCSREANGLRKPNAAPELKSLQGCIPVCLKPFRTLGHPHCP